MDKVVEVVAALIWQGNKFMICQRPAHKTRGLMWEFVGGKVEAGETGEQALVRECAEELGTTVSVQGIFAEVTHVYPDMKVHLTLYHARIERGKPEKREHNDIKWIEPDEADDYDFCPADVTILDRIKREYRERNDSV